MKKFKAKKRIKFHFKKIFILLVLIISFYLGKIFIKNMKLVSSNEEFLNAILKDSTHYKLYEGEVTLLDKMAVNVIRMDIKKPVTLIQNFFGVKIEKEKLKETIMQVSTIKEDNPIVYIYNSHPLENYDTTNYEAYNISPNTQMASYILQENLKKLGINSIVEKNSVTTYLSERGLDYNHSYEASRYYMEQAILDYPTLNFFIDLHRDAIKKNSSTCTIDGKKYARYLFVVGLEHSNYKYNLELANRLNDKTNHVEACLSRGVLTKQGYGVNGIYNQDLNKNVILIEIGGYENTIDEVMNTLDIFAKIVKDEIDGK